MAVRSPQEIRATSLREARFLYKKLELNSFLANKEETDINILNQAINDKIKATSKNDTDICQLIDNLSQEMRKNILPVVYFNWMHDDLACLYAWGRIRAFKNSEALDKTILPIIGISWLLKRNEYPVKERIFYEELSLKEKPSSTEERLYTIMEFFDSEQHQMTLENKISLINKLEDEWNIIYDNKKPFNWLNEKDEKQCTWTWEYIKKHSDFCQYLSPKTNREKYLSIFISLYLWSTNEDAKKLFLLNIGKANSQKKFRESVKEKKAVNIFIDKKIKKKLDEISTKKGLKINKTIEYLIEKEYENQKSNGME